MVRGRLPSHGRPVLPPPPAQRRGIEPPPPPLPPSLLKGLSHRRPAPRKGPWPSRAATAAQGRKPKPDEWQESPAGNRCAVDGRVRGEVPQRLPPFYPRRRMADKARRPRRELRLPCPPRVETETVAVRQDVAPASRRSSVVMVKAKRRKNCDVVSCVSPCACCLQLQSVKPPGCSFCQEAGSA